MDERPDSKTFTCRLQTREGRLPNPEALQRSIHAFSSQFSVRGIEVTVRGKLIQKGDDLILQSAQTDENLRLVPLLHKVQWDPHTKRSVSPSRKEREAYKRLTTEWKRHVETIQIVGPFSPGSKEKPSQLEVRDYTWAPEKSSPTHAE